MPLKIRQITFLILIATLILTPLLFSCDNDCAHEEFDIKEFAPTCDTEGYTMHYCKSCSFEFKTDIVPPNGHTLNREVFAPLCTEEGYTYYSCECGYSYKTDFVEPLGHTLRKEQTAPTCEGQGYTSYICACGYSYKADYTAPNGHKFTHETVAPSCLTSGHTTHTCSVCRYSYTSDPVAPTNHTLFSERIYPTISSDGYIRTYCKENCGYEYVTSPMRSDDVYSGAYVSNTQILAYGVDVSHWNGTVNWSELKEAGIDFVILKAGGTEGKDKTFDSNYEGAKAAGLGVGCYYYAYALTVDKALEDAENFAKMIEGKQFEYPVFLDLEDPTQADLESKLLTDIAFTFIEAMQSKGFFCGLYVNKDWLIDKLDTSRITADIDVWLARWLNSGEPNWPDSFGTRTGMWQYTNLGRIGSHSCDFDRNVAFKNYPDLIKGLCLNGF